MMGDSAEAGKVELALLNVSTYTHYHVNMRTDLIMGSHHANPADPQIDEFMLQGLEIGMIVNEHERQPGPQSAKTGANPLPKHPDTP